MLAQAHLQILVAAPESVIPKFVMLDRAAQPVSLRHLTDARFVGRLLRDHLFSANSVIEPRAAIYLQMPHAA